MKDPSDRKGRKGVVFRLGKGVIPNSILEREYDHVHLFSLIIRKRKKVFYEEGWDLNDWRPNLCVVRFYIYIRRREGERGESDFLSSSTTLRIS